MGAFLRQDGAELDAAGLSSLAQQADYILIGESHTNPCDHAAAADILHTLAAAHIAWDLGLEMLPRDSQGFLDASPSREALARHWDDIWGYPLSLYAPIFDAAQRHGARLVGLNVPWSVAQGVRDGHIQPPDHRLPQTIIPPCPEQTTSLEQQFALHQHLRDGSAPQLDGFIRVQSLWDSVMAETAIAWRQQHGRKMVILAGAGHLERGWGIPYRIHRLDPAARMLVVLPWRDASSLTDAQSSCVPHLRFAFFACPAIHRSRLGMTLDATEGGLVVQSVEASSRAAAMGLAPGDRLMAVNETTVHSAEDLHAAAATATRRGEPMRFTVERGGRILTLTVPR